ncbi:retinoid-inducible serine carboxypeptidase-like isoform X2 [Chelonus insularis]|uniref:retinoid-inducible serine carboxypeptidase-like isoform X2 n=1 Tax=Chelonus insularis TaxID=460826 RepID=UPI0015884E71|nr:retinoid-inducible serine carboxypeptidase-like isoform X2 [Chelonus insularis]
MLKVFIILSFCLVFGVHAQISNVKEGFGPGKQDWGYIKVRRSSQMFWWLFYVNSQNKSDNLNVYEKPLLIWLQGGPDNPIGTGFSDEESEQDVKLSDKQITVDLIQFMKNFLEIKPKFLNTPVYVLGESYGGKMAANFVWGWWEYQQNTSNKINLKGIALCSPWISPVDSLRALPPYLYNLGLLDNMEYKEIKNLTKYTINAINENDWLTAYNLWNTTIRRSIIIINHRNMYNILKISAPLVKARDYTTSSIPLCTNETVDWATKLERLMNTKVKRTLNLNNFNRTWKIITWSVYKKLKNDIMKPTTLTVNRILEETNLKVFVLSGQLDFIVPTTGTLRWVENLKWNSIKHWKNATKISISVDNVVEGYVKEYDKFKFFWISRAGHMLPEDNPKAMIAVLKDLTS